MRHGQSTINVERRLTCHQYDGDLTPLGREQAMKAGRWLADKHISKILHSPFHRADQTAAIAGEILGIKPKMDADLCEMNCGDLHGRTDDEAWQIFFSIYMRWKQGEWEAQYPGGESYRQGFERYCRCLNGIAPDENVLLVTHGGITCSIIPYLCVNAAALHSVVNAAALQHKDELDHCGFVVLEPYDAGRYICRSWNLVEHLEAE
jgi:probable phosphoglycerate mutase